jgi:hypothetical protein
MGEITAWSSPVDLVIASTTESHNSLAGIPAAVLTSVTGQASHTESESPIEPPGVVSEEVPTSAEDELVVINNLAVTEDAMAILDAVVSEVTVKESDFDAVMAEWQSADWWVQTSESSESDDMKSVTALATGLALVVRKHTVTEDRRKKRN